MSENKKDRFESLNKGGAHIARAGSKNPAALRKTETHENETKKSANLSSEAQDINTAAPPTPVPDEETEFFQPDGALINDIWSEMFPEDSPEDTDKAPENTYQPTHLKDDAQKSGHIKGNADDNPLNRRIDPSVEPTLVMPNTNFAAAIALSRRHKEKTYAAQSFEPLLLPPLPEEEEQETVAHKTRKPKTERKHIRFASAFLVLTFFISFGAFFAAKAIKGSKEQLETPIATAVRGKLATYVEGNGLTAASNREELGEDTKGIISSVLVEIGDEVVKDEVLIEINPTDLRIELANAEQELANAQMNVTSAQMDVRSAQDAVTALNMRLSLLEVTAPFTGKLIPAEDASGTAKTYHIGQQVGSGETIGYMVDDENMKLSIDFDAQYSDDIKAGAAANVSVSAQPDLLTGIVTSVTPVDRVGENGEKLINVTLDVENPGGITQGTKAIATFSPDEDKDITPASPGTFDYSKKEAVITKTGGEIVSIGGMDKSAYTGGAIIMTLSNGGVQSDISGAQNKVSIQQNEVAAAQREVQMLEKKVLELKKKVANANIRASMDGVVVNLNAKEGQTVKGEKTLVTVADLKNVIVNADVASSDVINVQPGQSVEITGFLGNGNEFELTGTVSSVALEPRPESAQVGGTPMFPAVIEVDPIEGQSIPIGQSVEYRITTDISYDSILVPNEAIVNTEDGAAVFARPAEGEVFSGAITLPEGTKSDVPEDFVLVPVETGSSDSENTEILWGINEGTSVYLARQDLYPGTAEAE